MEYLQKAICCRIVRWAQRRLTPNEELQLLKPLVVVLVMIPINKRHLQGKRNFMARVIKPTAAPDPGWVQNGIANFVMWQRDLPPARYWLILACGAAFASFGIRFALRGVQALQQGKDWSSLLATGNFRMPYVTVGREIISGSIIIVFCFVLLSGMVASRCGWLDRFVD